MVKQQSTKIYTLKCFPQRNHLERSAVPVLRGTKILSPCDLRAPAASPDSQLCYRYLPGNDHPVLPGRLVLGTSMGNHLGQYIK